MAEENRSWSPRETAIRMLEHMPDDVSYEDVMRQLRILQEIEWVMEDVEVAGIPADENPPEELEEDAPSIRFTPDKSALVLRSRPLFNWRSLADRSEDRSDPLIGKASWIY